MKIHSQFNKRVIMFVVCLGVLVSGAVFAVYTSHWARGISAWEFKPGRIIDDEIFYNKDSMSAAQIQAFLDRLIPNCDVWGQQRAVAEGRPDLTRAQYAKIRWGANAPFPCLNKYHENPKTGETSFEKGGGWFPGGLSAAQIIYNAAQEYHINPQVLLVLLRKESINLTGDTWPLKSQYKYAMGYACPDSGPGHTANCNNAKAGFYKQMSLAAWQLNYYRHHRNDYSLHMGMNNIQYSPNPACGTKPVYIENIATLSLYIYTPYTPNDASLTNYPGTAHCGAYGNRNFFMFFNEWFGSTWRIVNPIPSNVQISTNLPYTLSTASNLALDIPGNSSTNGAKMQIFSSNNSPAQKFTFAAADNGHYVIKNQNGKVLDLAGGSTANGNPIQMYAYNGTCAQKWSLIRKPNGKYKILSACNGKKALDINGARTNRNGEKVQLWDDNNSVAQEWGLGNNSSAVYGINDQANYTIKNVGGSYLAVAASGAMTISKSNPKTYQIQKQHSGLYRIMDMDSKKYVGYSSTSQSLTINSNPNSPSNQWYFVKQGGETIIYSQLKNFVFDVSGGRIHNDGESVLAFEFNGSNAQKWIIERVQTPPSNVQISTNLPYTLSTASNLALDIPGNSSTNGAKMQIFSSNNSPAQKFTFAAADNGHYVIKNQNGKVLDLAGGSTANGNPIQMYAYNGTCAQKWSLIRKPNGKYKILSACNGKKALDINGARTNRNGEKVQLWDDNNSVAQEWGLGNN